MDVNNNSLIGVTNERFVDPSKHTIHNFNELPAVVKIRLIYPMFCFYKVESLPCFLTGRWKSYGRLPTPITCLCWLPETMNPGNVIVVMATYFFPNLREVNLPEHCFAVWLTFADCFTLFKGIIWSSLGRSRM